MKDIKTEPITIRSLINQIEHNKYNFDLAIQRRGDIWKTKEKSLFIDTLLRDYPIYPALVNKHSDSKILDVVDFKQRFTIIKDFEDNKFALSKGLEPVVIDDVEYEISGKKFKKLDDAVKEKFYNRSISIITMTDATEKEISDIFDRINSGHPLNNGQKRSTIQSDEVRDIVYSLASHPFLEKVLSKAQYKNNVDRDVVIQVLMLIEKTDQYDFGSFKNDDMNKFISYYNEKITTEEGKKNIELKISNVKKALDKLNEELGDDVKIKQLTLPFVIYGMYRMFKDSKSTTKYLEWLNDFLKNYYSNMDYLQYCSSGTASAEMVNGRLQYFRNAIKTL